jgi:hypothetical protein
VSDVPGWDAREIRERGDALLAAMSSSGEDEAGRVFLILMAAMAQLYRMAPPAARGVFRSALRLHVDELDARSKAPGRYPRNRS